MTGILPGELARFVRAVGPRPDETVERMEARASREGFPTVGRAVGATLAFLVGVADVRRAFEFGSGYGYSAYWIARALPADGQVVLTERDPEELDDAREYFSGAGLADRARFEEGDALSTVDRYDGPFDLVVIDNEKTRYVEAFEAVRPKVAPGGLVVADNVMTATPVEFEALLEFVEGEDPGEVSPETRGVADYLARTREDDAFETVALPIGEGIAVSHRRE